MSRLSDLLRQVARLDPALGADLDREVKVLSQRRPFGLNFERHQPESVEMPGRPVRGWDKVRILPPRGSVELFDDRLWFVQRVRGGTAALVELGVSDEPERCTRPVEDLVVVAEFKEPIYPGLVSTGRVMRGGDKPFHAVINAENYHALEALAYTHEGKVDAIYIDPPYNSGARDWKYNNDYVDGDDVYRHSKWLAFVERRLKLAKRLLNPESSVLIVTIDEKEYLRLGLLLRQVFPEAAHQMVTSVINPKGTGRAEGFMRVDEYVFIVWVGRGASRATSTVAIGSRALDGTATTATVTSVTRIPFDTARRRDLTSVRPTRPGQFYPIYVNAATGRIEEIGDPLPHDVNRFDAPQREGCVAVFPVRDDGTEMNWGVTAPTFRERWRKGYARAGSTQPGKPQQYIIQYLKSGPIADIEAGRADVIGRNDDGSVIAQYARAPEKWAPTVWNLRSHSAEHYGTKIIRSLAPGRMFDFPKSLYAVEDALRFFVSDKPDAVVLDFFAGSGTTAHAVMRLNKQDGGRRQCISVTNNEVSAEEQRKLRAEGLRPGDPDWEKWGICDYITKPRIRAAIEGRTPDGEPIEGDYKFTDEFPMADGFEENVEFFTLTYEAPRAVAHHKSFEAIAPLLWLRAGARGRRIDDPSETFDVAETYGVLFSVDATAPFVEALTAETRLAFIVTDDERAFQMVCAELPEHVEPVRLYESYLSNFVNGGEA